MFEVFSNTCSRLARGPAADEGVCPTLDAAVANPLSDEHWGKPEPHPSRELFLNGPIPKPGKKW